MSAFVWYVVNLEDGSVKGTNDTEALQASGLTTNDSYVVIHKDSGTVVDPSSGECESEIIPMSFNNNDNDNNNDNNNDNEDDDYDFI